MNKISVSADDFKLIDENFSEDFQQLNADSKRLFGRMSEIFDLAQEFESKFHEIPELLEEKDNFNQEKANYFEKESEAAIEEIRKLLVELKDAESKIDTMFNDLERLLSHLDHDEDLLKEGIIDIEEEKGFNIDKGPAPGAAD